jgi:hypothetical protein
MNKLLSLLTLAACCAMGVPATAGDLIAHYRFETNGDDSLGRSPPFVLTTTQWGSAVPPLFPMTGAPFTNGVLHVNGVYEPNGHFSHYLGTAPNPQLRYDSFTFSLDFYPLPQRRSRYSLGKLENLINNLTRDRYLRWRGIDPNSGVVNQDNILTGGYHYRWLGFNRQSGCLQLTLNDRSFIHPFKGATVKAERWHNLICSVDLRRKEIRTLSDGRPLETLQLPSDFKLNVVDSPEAGGSRALTFADYSNGSVFYGYVADLRLFDSALNSSELVNLYTSSRRPHPEFAKRGFPWAVAVSVALFVAFVALLAIWVLRRLRRQRASLSYAPL